MKPIVDGRCVVCHGCYDAPCQLILSSVPGLERGASKEVVYDGDRLLPAEPSRLFVDAKTTQGWRERGFFSVLQPGPDSEAGLLRLMLELGAAHVFPAGRKLPPEVELGLGRELSCAKPEEFDDYAADHPLWGMPYGTAPLTEEELGLLSD